ncbi:MAG TPA: amidohydrolase [Chitinophagaceae bacterium]|nr:amidohydrolase [Chitinophagaceae bacterium]
MKKTLIILLSAVTPALFAQSPADKLKTKAYAAADKADSKCIEWRRDFHQNPELGNREFRTSKIIAEHLKKLGIETKENVAKTGVVGILKGAKPGPCIALRADIDALPVTERVNIPFASKQKTTFNGQEVGVMHACGHDTHTAMLMTVAEILSGMKNELAGTIKFIFQPAEEGAPAGEEGGAALMVKEGVMENPKVDVVFGLHIQSDVPVGKITYKPGALMAAADWFTIKVKGKGTHGSQPWKGVDPIQVSAQIIEGLQNIVSRQMELPKAPVVITVGKISGGVRQNIISEDCEMSGTIRTLDSKMQEDVHQKIKWTAEKIAEANGAAADVSFETKTLVTYNTPELVTKMLPSLKAAAGEENVKETHWVTGAEDFSYYGTKAPSMFFFIGGMPKDNTTATAAPHHTADFYIDESGMKTGVKAFCALVFDYMYPVK